MRGVYRASPLYAKRTSDGSLSDCSAIQRDRTSWAHAPVLHGTIAMRTMCGKLACVGFTFSGVTIAPERIAAADALLERLCTTPWLSPDSSFEALTPEALRWIEERLDEHFALLEQWAGEIQSKKYVYPSPPPPRASPSQSFVSRVRGWFSGNSAEPAFHIALPPVPEVQVFRPWKRVYAERDPVLATRMSIGELPLPSEEPRSFQGSHEESGGWMQALQNAEDLRRRLLEQQYGREGRAIRYLVELQTREAFEQLPHKRVPAFMREARMFPPLESAVCMLETLLLDQALLPAASPLEPLLEVWLRGGWPLPTTHGSLLVYVPVRERVMEHYPPITTTDWAVQGVHSSVRFLTPVQLRSSLADMPVPGPLLPPSLPEDQE